MQIHVDEHPQSPPTQPQPSQPVTTRESLPSRPQLDYGSSQAVDSFYRDVYAKRVESKDQAHPNSLVPQESSSKRPLQQCHPSSVPPTPPAAPSPLPQMRSGDRSRETPHRINPHDSVLIQDANHLSAQAQMERYVQQMFREATESLVLQEQLQPPFGHMYFRPEMRENFMEMGQQITEEPRQRPRDFMHHPCEPIQVPRESVQVPREPVQVPREPVQVPHEPVQLPREPVQLAREPVQLPREPVQQTELQPTRTPPCRQQIYVEAEKPDTQVAPTRLPCNADRPETKEASRMDVNQPTVEQERPPLEMEGYRAEKYAQPVKSEENVAPVTCEEIMMLKKTSRLRAQAQGDSVLVENYLAEMHPDGQKQQWQLPDLQQSTSVYGDTYHRGLPQLEQGELPANLESYVLYPEAMESTDRGSTSAQLIQLCEDFARCSYNIRHQNTPALCAHAHCDELRRAHAEVWTAAAAAAVAAAVGQACYVGGGVPVDSQGYELGGEVLKPLAAGGAGRAGGGGRGQHRDPPDPDTQSLPYNVTPGSSRSFGPPRPPLPSCTNPMCDEYRRQLMIKMCENQEQDPFTEDACVPATCSFLKEQQATPAHPPPATPPPQASQQNIPGDNCASPVCAEYRRQLYMKSLEEQYHNITEHQRCTNAMCEEYQRQLYMMAMEGAPPDEKYGDLGQEPYPETMGEPINQIAERCTNPKCEEFQKELYIKTMEDQLRQAGYTCSNPMCEEYRRQLFQHILDQQFGQNDGEPCVLETCTDPPRAPRTPRDARSQQDMYGKPCVRETCSTNSVFRQQQAPSVKSCYAHTCPADYQSAIIKPCPGVPIPFDCRPQRSATCAVQSCAAMSQHGQGETSSATAHILVTATTGADGPQITVKMQPSVRSASAQAPCPSASPAPECPSFRILQQPEPCKEDTCDFPKPPLAPSKSTLQQEECEQACVYTERARMEGDQVQATPSQANAAGGDPRTNLCYLGRQAHTMNPESFAGLLFSDVPPDVANAHQCKPTCPRIMKTFPPQVPREDVVPLPPPVVPVLPAPSPSGPSVRPSTTPSSTSGFRDQMSTPLCPSKSVQVCPSKSGRICPSKSGQVCPKKTVKICPSKAVQVCPAKFAQRCPSKTVGVCPSKSVQVCPSKSGGVCPAKRADVTLSRSGPMSASKSAQVNIDVAPSKSTQIGPIKSGKMALMPEPFREGPMDPSGPMESSAPVQPQTKYKKACPARTVASTKSTQVVKPHGDGVICPNKPATTPSLAVICYSVEPERCICKSNQSTRPTNSGVQMRYPEKETPNLPQPPSRKTSEQGKNPSTPIRDSQKTSKTAQGTPSQAAIHALQANPYNASLIIANASATSEAVPPGKGIIPYMGDLDTPRASKVLSKTEVVRTVFSASGDNILPCNLASLPGPILCGTVDSFTSEDSASHLGDSLSKGKDANSVSKILSSITVNEAGACAQDGSPLSPCELPGAILLYRPTPLTDAKQTNHTVVQMELPGRGLMSFTGETVLFGKSMADGVCSCLTHEPGGQRFTKVDVTVDLSRVADIRTMRRFSRTTGSPLAIGSRVDMSGDPISITVEPYVPSASSNVLGDDIIHSSKSIADVNMSYSDTGPPAEEYDVCDVCEGIIPPEREDRDRDLEVVHDPHAVHEHGCHATHCTRNADDAARATLCPIHTEESDGAVSVGGAPVDERVSRSESPLHGERGAGGEVPGGSRSLPLPDPGSGFLEQLLKKLRERAGEPPDSM